MTSTQSLTIHVTFYVKESSVTQLLSALEPVIAQIKADEDLAYFNVFHGIDAKDTIRITEIWNCSYDALKAVSNRILL